MNKIRGSSYNIYVKLSDAETLLVHGYTGAVRKVPSGIVNYIRSLDNPAIGGALFTSVPSDILYSELKRDGFITDMTLKDEIEFISRINSNLHERNRKGKPEFMIVPTYSCNFNCYYCYEKDMRISRGDSYVNSVMSNDMCRMICSAMMEIENQNRAPGSDCNNPVQVTFYGGEPLQRVTSGVVTSILQQLLPVNRYTFSAITNGYELEYFRDILSPEMFSEVQVTIDSVPEVHNKRRTLKNSSAGTFHKIADNISMALDKGVDVNVRVNTDRDTIIRIEELTCEMAARGWGCYDNFRVSLAPVFRLKGDPGHDRCLNYGTLFNELKNYSTVPGADNNIRAIVSQEEYFDSMEESLINGLPLTSHFKSSICNSMGTLFIFDLYGDIYPCFEKVGRKESVLGNVSSDKGTVFNDEVHDRWRGRIATSNDKCGRCSYTLFCGGGCASRAEDSNGTIYSSYCDGFPLFFQSKIMELYLKNGKARGVTESVLYGAPA
jgi:uncharacterized protein